MNERFRAAVRRLIADEHELKQHTSESTPVVVPLISRTPLQPIAKTRRRSSGKNAKASLKVLNALGILTQHLDVIETTTATESQVKHVQVSVEELEAVMEGFKDLYTSMDTVSTSSTSANSELEVQPAVTDETVKLFLTANFSGIQTKEDVVQAERRKRLLHRVISLLSNKPPTFIPTNPSSSSASASSSSLYDLPPDDLKELHHELSQMGHWNFNLFRVSALVPEHLLACVSLEVLRVHRLPFDIDRGIMSNFCAAVQHQYLSSNAYHNAEHAADVMQAMHYFLTTAHLSVSPTATLAALVAALVHDVAHPGVTNVFLTSRDDALAIRYAYRSPLEHMHCALTCEILTKPECNIFQNLDKAEVLAVRHLMVDLILATDNASHAMYLKQFEQDVLLNEECTYVREHHHGSYPTLLEHEQRLVLQVALHAADVSNPTKSLEVYQCWTSRIMSEFYDQGDAEREAGLKISIGFDRNKPIPEAKMQAGFIIGIVRPVYQALARVPGTDFSAPMHHLDANLSHYQQQIL